MPPNIAEAMAIANSDDPGNPSSVVDRSPNHPRLRKLASKPLKLAASTFTTLTGSRSSSPHPASIASTSDASSLTVVSSSQGGNTPSGATSTKSSRRLGRRRHQHMPSNGTTLTPAQVASAAKGPRKPLEGELPAGWLRVRVVKAEGLVAKDRRGTSDPFITLLLPPSHRHSTPVVKRTLDPVFPPETSTFDLPLHLSLAGVIGGRGLEGVVWDKDLMRKEYMGELSVPVQNWFPDGEVRLWHENLPVIKHSLLSTRRRHKVTGTVSLQIGFVQPPNTTDTADALRKVGLLYEAILLRGTGGRREVGVLGVPAHEGIGTVKMRTKRQDQSIVAPSLSTTVTDHSPKTLLQTATAVIMSPMASQHRMVSVGSANRDPAAEGDDDDEGDDEGLLADDGLSSSSSDDEMEDALEGDEDGYLRQSPEFGSVSDQQIRSEPDEISTKSSSMTPSISETGGAIPLAKTLGLLSPIPQARLPKTPARQSSLPDYFDHQQPNRGGDLSSYSPSVSGAATPGTSTPGGTKPRRPIFGRSKSRANGSDTPAVKANRKISKKQDGKNFNFDSSQGRDVLGIVIMEIKNASDLPKIKNSLRVSFDMDPFVVISFGKKVFRTRVIRHSLNPTWDEKLLFHVRRHESTFTIQYAVLDWDKVSGNDMVGTCTLPLSELVADAPKPNPETGLYGKEEDGKHEMKEFTLPIVTDKDMPWEARHSPKLTVRAKYEPYDALRQRFWRQYITQYDADDTGTMSYTELTAMLDSLGSTLTRRTIEGYFSSCGKSPETDELTIEEVIVCLEREVTKPRDEKEKVGTDEFIGQGSGAASPPIASQPMNQGLSTTGPQGNIQPSIDADELADHIRMSRPRDSADMPEPGPGNQHPVVVNSLGAGQTQHVPAVKVESTSSSDTPINSSPGPSSPSGAITPGSAISDIEELSSTPTDDRERIINIRTCPLCHRPRLSRKNEQDIVTHLAICASADWSRVDRIVTGNYVTSSQAQRKFFTKIINKVTIGAYSLGANSANILVQDRLTGQLQEEKMAVYVRLGIRVLYKGAKSRMEGARARRLLKSLSVKQGLKYDSPSSAVDIPTFIAFHGLNIDEILKPIESFKTFNEFFYRKLKPDARPIADPGDDGRLVSCADCRMMAFETVHEATQIWIKGREFTIARLLGSNYKDVVDRYEGGGLGIFRLAPQDYHRFHSPVAGTIGKMTLIDGEYYTVNPQAIRTTLDVYGENVRKIVPIQSEEFGLVMTVWVGAMMVGSIGTSVVEGQRVERADELGWFAFGGSTIVCLFEKGVLKWDEDLLANGRASIETLVRMGMGIGRSVKGKNGVGNKSLSNSLEEKKDGGGK